MYAACLHQPRYSKTLSRKRILTLTCHASFAYLDLIFVKSIGKAFTHRLAPDLQEVTQVVLGVDIQTSLRDYEMCLWSAFVAIAGQRQRTCRDRHVNQSQERTILFAQLRGDLSLDSPEQARVLFRQYLYLDETMDTVLESLWQGWEAL